MNARIFCAFAILLAPFGLAKADDTIGVNAVLDSQGVLHGTGLIHGGLTGITHIYTIDAQDNLPTAFDLRAQGKVSPIKDQGQCGSCWAHATVESLEDAILFAGSPGLVLSAQQMTSCNQDQYGCSGGFMTSADFLVSPGMALDSDFPYRARDVQCKANLPIAAKAKSWAFVGAQGRAATSDEIKAALVAHGSIFVTVAAGGYDWGGQATMTQCNNRGTNHMVEIVGWNEKSQWIMRNSWGQQWGDNGFAYMPFGCDSIASEEDSAAYTVFQ